MKLFYLLLFLGIFAVGCNTHRLLTTSQAPSVQRLAVKLDSLHTDSIEVNHLTLFDHVRNRAIPVAVYLPDSMPLKQTLIVFSHGYAENNVGAHTSYSYLTGYLAAKGYVVASIQHELPGDDLLPMTGNLQETRRPNWEQGVQNILFTINELKLYMPFINDKEVIVIGHSNGGDISLLFASEYPQKTVKAISLDNRRMPLPRIEKPKIYSLRANDLPANEGVLPNLKEQSQYGIMLVSLPFTKHAEMTDATTSEKQKREITHYVLFFLKDH